MGDPEDPLVQALSALASEVRLDILRQLRTPKMVKEILVRGKPRGPGRPGAPISRQTVKEHLDRLVEAGLVICQEGAGARGASEYVVDHCAFFRWSEQMRGLARMRPVAGPDAATLAAAPKDGGHAIQGPCLVLVHGLDEGERYDLAPSDAATDEWIIGRRNDLPVSLHFDPFVSGEHAIIVREGDDYFVEDLDSNQNGTWLNFRPLGRGGRHQLEHGDIVGAGLCLMTFRA